MMQQTKDLPPRTHREPHSTLASQTFRLARCQRVRIRRLTSLSLTVSIQVVHLSNRCMVVPVPSLPQVTPIVITCFRSLSLPTAIYTDHSVDKIRNPGIPDQLRHGHGTLYGCFPSPGRPTHEPLS